MLKKKKTKKEQKNFRKIVEKKKFFCDSQNGQRSKTKLEKRLIFFLLDHKKTHTHKINKAWNKYCMK